MLPCRPASCSTRGSQTIPFGTEIIAKYSDSNVDNEQQLVSCIPIGMLDHQVSPKNLTLIFDPPCYQHRQHQQMLPSAYLQRDTYYRDQESLGDNVVLISPLCDNTELMPFENELVLVLV